MDIFDYIDQMKMYIQCKDWNGLEANYRDIAQKLGSHFVNRIADTDISSYQQAICEGLRKAVASANELSAKAIYFEYDLDNVWDGSFFVCPNYNSEYVGSDDWACKWLDDFEGPDFQDFGNIFREEPGFDTPDSVMGTTLYLIARTVAAFGRCLDTIPSNGIAICMAFHDQDPVMRMRE